MALSLSEPQICKDSRARYRTIQDSRELAVMSRYVVNWIVEQWKKSCENSENRMFRPAHMA
jgi:hypothetical protein